MNKKVQWYFLGGISVLVATLGFLIFRPFIPSIAVAIFLALVFFPLYRKLLRLWPKKERLAAAVVVLAALVGVIVPLSFLTARLVAESRQVYAELTDVQFSQAEYFIDTVERQIQTILPDFALDIHAYVGSAANWAGTHISGFVFGTMESVFLVLLGVFLFYYFLRNGEDIKNALIELSPLPDTYDRQLVNAMKQTVNSVLRGSLFIAIIQGVLAGLGFWIFGVPNPVIWGSVAAASALLPGIGTALVLVPAVLYLFVNNQIGAAVGLAVWGVVIVGLIDNVLVPLFYGKNIRVHPVFVLLSVVGGLSVFGFLGFIFGPIILSLLVVLLDIYRLSLHTSPKPRGTFKMLA